MNLLVSSFLSLVGGGALYKIISAANESRKFRAEAQKTGVESDAIEMKIAPELADMSIATMERVHRQLYEDYQRIVAERDALQKRFDLMKTEFDALQEQFHNANETIENLQERMQHLMDSLNEEM